MGTSAIINLRTLQEEIFRIQIRTRRCAQTSRVESREIGYQVARDFMSSWEEQFRMCTQFSWIETSRSDLVKNCNLGKSRFVVNHKPQIQNRGLKLQKRTQFSTPYFLDRSDVDGCISSLWSSKKVHMTDHSQKTIKALHKFNKILSKPHFSTLCSRITNFGAKSLDNRRCQGMSASIGSHSVVNWWVRSVISRCTEPWKDLPAINDSGFSLKRQKLLYISRAFFSGLPEILGLFERLMTIRNAVNSG